MLYESSEKLHSPDKHDDEFVVSVVSNPLTVLLTLRKPFEGFLTEEVSSLFPSFKPVNFDFCAVGFGLPPPPS